MFFHKWKVSCIFLDLEVAIGVAGSSFRIWKILDWVRFGWGILANQILIWEFVFGGSGI